MLLCLTYDSPPFSLPPMFHLSASPNRRRAAFKTPPFPGRRRSLRMAAARCMSIEYGRPELAHRLKRVVEVSVRAAR